MRFKVLSNGVGLLESASGRIALARPVDSIESFSAMLNQFL